MKSIINALCLLCLVCLLWVGISWLEVIDKSYSPNPQYSETNFFCEMLDD